MVWFRGVRLDVAHSSSTWHGPVASDSAKCATVAAAPLNQGFAKSSVRRATAAKNLGTATFSLRQATWT